MLGIYTRAGNDGRGLFPYPGYITTLRDGFAVSGSIRSTKKTRPNSFLCFRSSSTTSSLLMKQNGHPGYYTRPTDAV